MNFSYKMLNHILMKFYILRQPLNQTGDERIELPLRVLRLLSYHLTNPLYKNTVTIASHSSNKQHL